MWQFISAPENLPFTVAIAILLGLCLIEAVGLLLGFALSGLLDGAADVDVDADADIGPLHWVGFGAAPALFVLLVLLGFFGLLGLGTQAVLVSTTGKMTSPWLLAPVCILAALPLTRLTSKAAGKYLFREDSLAVSAESFVGKPATLTAGVSQKGRACEAKLRDEHGQTHYVLVEPYNEGDTFHGGSEVLIVEKVGSVYRVVGNTVDELASFEHQPLRGEEA